MIHSYFMLIHMEHTYLCTHALRSSVALPSSPLIIMNSFQSCRILWTSKHHEIFVAAGLLFSRIHFISHENFIVFHSQFCLFLPLFFLLCAIDGNTCFIPLTAPPHSATLHLSWEWDWCLRLWQRAKWWKCCYLGVIAFELCLMISQLTEFLITFVTLTSPAVRFLCSPSHHNHYANSGIDMCFQENSGLIYVLGNLSAQPFETWCNHPTESGDGVERMLLKC